MGRPQHEERGIRIWTLGDEVGLNAGKYMSYESEYKANCFSSSNSAMNILDLVVDKCRKYIQYWEFKI